MDENRVKMEGIEKEGINPYTLFIKRVLLSKGYLLTHFKIHMIAL
jgi:hypothetical protein